MQAESILRRRKCTIVFIAFVLAYTRVHAQEAYEIQVYSSPTMTKYATIFELHNNISPSGPKSLAGFTHPVHETLEVTTGITNNFEIGFYLFNRINSGSLKYIGSHIRPRISVPGSWNWNVGASLSVEVGFVKDPISKAKDWDYEIRPIIDKTISRHYISINPTVEGSFTTKEVAFTPNIKYAYAIHPKYSMGFEYYGAVGRPFNWDKYAVQTHQIYAVTDLFLDPRYECIFGRGSWNHFQFRRMEHQADTGEAHNLEKVNAPACSVT